MRRASWAAVFPFRRVVRLPFDSSPFDQSGIDVMCHFRKSTVKELWLSKDVSGGTVVLGLRRGG